MRPMDVHSLPCLSSCNHDAWRLALWQMFQLNVSPRNVVRVEGRFGRTYRLNLLTRRTYLCLPPAFISSLSWLSLPFDKAGCDMLVKLYRTVRDHASVRTSDLPPSPSRTAVHSPLKINIPFEVRAACARNNSHINEKPQLSPLLPPLCLPVGLFLNPLHCHSKGAQSLTLTDTGSLIHVPARHSLHVKVNVFRPLWGRGSSVGIVTRYGLDGWGFSLIHSVQTGSGAHPAAYAMGTGGKAAKAWSWPLTSLYCRGQELWSYSSTPPYVFMAWCLANNRNEFTLPYRGLYALPWRH
jgi:hypothetical protein